MKPSKSLKPGEIKAALLITAAGSSRRLGEGEKKEYRPLRGRPVLIQALEPFLLTELFSQVIITIPKGDQRKVEELLDFLSPDLKSSLQKIKLVEGGSTRQASVLRGLETFDPHAEIVLIHDGARPWIGGGTIIDVMQSAATYGACIPVVPSVDAMKQITSDGVISAHLGRAETVCAQTPQGFRYDDILQAHHRAASDGTYYIDDSEIYSRYIGEVHTVDGERENRKITFLSDFGNDREGEK